MKILVAVDGSNCNRMAIEFIASRKTLIAGNPDVHVLNVRWKLPYHPARLVGSEVVRKYYADEAEKARGQRVSNCRRQACALTFDS